MLLSHINQLWPSFAPWRADLGFGLEYDPPNTPRSNETGLARRSDTVDPDTALRADYAKVGGMERTYAADNARELARLRALVSKLSDQDLGSMVNEYWTVAGVLGHMAFWDGRALFLARKLQRDEAFTASDAEPENVDWINDSTRPLIHAIPPRQAAEVALRIARETDELVASLSPELVAKIDDNSPLNPVRAHHRGEHLDEIEAALAGKVATRRPT